MAEKENAREGVSSGGYSSIIKRYVKGARKVNGDFALESTSSLNIALAGLQGACPGWLPRVASGWGEFRPGGFPGFLRGIHLASGALG